MSLCLTFHVNLGLSLRKTAQALEDLYNIRISHTMVANYCKTAAVVIKPFVDHFDYQKSDVFIADETYIKVKGKKGYIWFIMDAVSRSVLGYQVSDNRSVGPCILAMRMAFSKIRSLPQSFQFIADGYSAYPLAAQQFAQSQMSRFSLTSHRSSVFPTMMLFPGSFALSSRWLNGSTAPSRNLTAAAAAMIILMVPTIPFPFGLPIITSCANILPKTIRFLIPTPCLTMPTICRENGSF